MFGKDYFEVTEEHIKLIQNTYWSWNDCEFGSPSIDCKRPFGDRLADLDMYNILNNTDVEYEDVMDELDDLWETKYKTLYNQLVTVLEIGTQTLKFEIGNYERERYGGKWKKVE